MSVQKKRRQIPDIPVENFAEDSMFPFKGSDSILVKVTFKLGNESKLMVEKWKEPAPTE
jgi:hypothetical protein